MTGLAYESIGAGPPLVLLHGGGPGCTSRLDFAPVLDRLAATHRLLLVDLTPHADGPVFTFHARGLAALLDSLGVTGADFACQSLGGSVALRLAAQRPDLVRRMTVTGSQPVPGGATLGPSVRAGYYGDEGPTRDKMRALLAELEWHDAERLPESTVLGRHAQSVTPAALRVSVDRFARGTPEDLSEVLPTVGAPVLFVWGAHDPFAGPGYAVRLASRLPRADVLVLARTAHHPQEERPAAYAAAVSAFLAA